MPGPKRPQRSTEFYYQEIQELISDCTHSGVLDEEEFHNKISGLQAAASVDGLCPIEFKRMIQENLLSPKLKESA